MKNCTLFLASRALPLTMGLLLLLLGCSDPIGPSESCSGQPANASVKFEDANLERRIREDLEAFGQIGPGDDLTCGLLSGKTAFGSSANIRSLGGIQNLTSLTVLHLSNNSISDISPLSGLTSLETLFLGTNSITDTSPRSGLTRLRGRAPIGHERSGRAGPRRSRGLEEEGKWRSMRSTIRN